MPTSTRLGIVTPVGSDPVAIPADLLAMATVLDAKTAMDDQGAIASRPVSTVGTPGIRGRYYYATDEDILYRDYGTGWTTLNPPDVYTNRSEGYGVMGYQDFRVRQKLSGANMSVDVGPGEANLLLTTNNYFRVQLPALSNSGAVGAVNSPQWTVTFTTAHATLPRIDRVVVQRSLTVVNGFTLVVVAGTATSGATLDNLTGAASVPANALLLADVLVSAAATTIPNANIRDRRPQAVYGVTPFNSVSASGIFDMVEFLPFPGAQLAYGGLGGSGFGDERTACAMYLPRRIVGCNRIYWKYKVATTISSSAGYRIAIHDATGRRIIDTGLVTWTGTSGNWIDRGEIITATTFEQGWYYTQFSPEVISGQADGYGVSMRVGSAGTQGGIAGLGGYFQKNVAFHSTAGGPAIVDQVTTYTDLGAQATDLDRPVHPIFQLGVA